MPWPRGKPRKGHIKKDGSAHGRLGRKPKDVLEQERKTKAVITIDLRSGETTTVLSQRKVVHGRKSGRVNVASSATSASPTVTTGSVSRRRKFGTQLVHPQYIIEACPNCEFPEADGGYCPDCGWTRQAMIRQPANSIQGKLFAKR